ncbi:MAG: flagellin [Alphaproteobacteria bacterium]
MADVILTAALRSNLLSLQGTQRLLDQTQLRLATGLRVNSALDNPAQYFAAQSLNNRASDLSRLLDNMGQAIQVLKTTDKAIQSLTSLVQQAQALAQQAKDDASAGAPQASIDVLATSYDGIMTQIDNLVGDSGYRGTNLLEGSATMTVTFNETGSSTLDVPGVNFVHGDSTGPTGLGIDTATGVWDVNNISTTIDVSLAQLSAALTVVRNQAEAFGTNLNILQTREDFTQNIINTLKEGADKLTIADKNEEGAKLLSLQTTQQLGITSLSLASQANQAILRLFQ